MNIDQVLILLKKKNITASFILKNLQKVIIDFENKKEAFYLTEIKQQVLNENIDVKSINIDEHAALISKKLQNDSIEYMSHYTSTLTDQLLDAINQKLIKKEPAHKFLTILLTLNDKLSESSSYSS